MIALDTRRVLNIYLQYNGKLHLEGAQANLEALGIDSDRTFAIAELLKDGVVTKGEFDDRCPLETIIKPRGCINRFDKEAIHALEALGNSPARALRKKLLAERDPSKLPRIPLPDINILYAMGNEELKSLDGIGVRNALIWMLSNHVDPNRFAYIESKDYWVDADDGCISSSECLEQSARKREETHRPTPKDIEFLRRLAKEKPNAGRILSQIEWTERFVMHTASSDMGMFDIDITAEVLEEIIPTIRAWL